MIRTGIYGGSFNPIHTGHILLGEHLVTKGFVDELWYVVSPQNPFKVNQALLDDEARLELARIAVDGKEKLKVCDVEFRLPRPSYMIHTLKTLSTTYTDREFILVIGADNWERFPRWYENEKILQHYRVMVYPRPGYTLQDIPDNVTIVPTPLYDISSTHIRKRIARWKDEFNGEGLIPEVWNEIKEKKYYY